MTKYSLLFFAFLLTACVGKHSSDAQKVVTSDPGISTNITIGDTLNINLSSSNIYWKGTKMRGAGKHEGDIQLKDGFFITQYKQIVGGQFAIDMHSIEVTDIPKTDPIPIKNLTDHLKNADFFDVEKHPTSTFKIINVKSTSSDSLQITGNLTLKNITKQIEFIAFYQNNLFSTTFSIDRFQWNIAYEGNWADKTLVDKDIELKIKLVVN
jgi:polyisoprenoid-binding protein YceI